LRLPSRVVRQRKCTQGMEGIFAVDCAAELMDRQVEVEDEVQCLRDQVLGLQGELRLAVCKMTTVCSLIKFDSPEKRANPVHLSGEQDAVSLWSLSMQLVQLQKDMSQATEFHKQSAHGAWARADQMFDKASDKVDGFHKYCAGLVTMCEAQTEKAAASLPTKVEVATEVVEPLLANEAFPEECKVLRNLKALEKEIQDAYAEDYKKLQNLVGGLDCAEVHQRNEHAVQDCLKALEPETHTQPEPEIVGMNTNDIAQEKKANNVLRRDSQQRRDKGAQLVGSELKQMQEELVSRFRANGCSWQASAVSSKSNSKSVSWDCSEASDCPEVEMVRDIPQVKVQRQTSVVPPLRLSGLGAVRSPGQSQSARPFRLPPAREQVLENCTSLSSSRASTTCSSPGLTLSSGGSPRVDLVRFLSCGKAEDPKPISSVNKEDPKLFDGCQGGPVRMQSARVNRHFDHCAPYGDKTFSPPMAALRPLTCR